MSDLSIQETLQVVFVGGPIVEHWRPKRGLTYVVDHGGSSCHQLWSPRVANMLINPLSFDDTKVLYIRITQGRPSEGSAGLSSEVDHWKAVYNLVFDCRSNASCHSMFFLGTTTDLGLSLEDLMERSKVYIPGSAQRLTPGMSMVQRLVISAYLFQGMHVLRLWHDRGLLEGVTSERLIGGIKVQHMSSKCVHRAFEQHEGCVWSTSTPFIGHIVDYYKVVGNFAGPNSQLNFMGDPEYRYALATRLFEVLKAFVISNMRSPILVNTVGDVEAGLKDILLGQP